MILLSETPLPALLISSSSSTQVGSHQDPHETEGLSASTVNHVEEKHMVEALQRNGYPKGFIQRQTCLRAGRAAQQGKETRATLTLPYIGGLSESLNQVDPQPTWPSRSFCPFKTLKQELVHPKDPVAVSKRKGVIYSIPCAECPCGLRDHWTCACKNIVRPLRRVMSLALLLQNMYLKQATRWTCPRHR